MVRKSVLEKLDEIFRKVFDDESISLNDATTADDVEGWDSLEHINLIIAVEKMFHIKFDMEEVNSFKNIGEMVDMIMSKTNKQ